MDDYEKKFAEMQKYIPFLEAMIERLQKVTDKSREVQLHKMQQLHGILTDSKRKLRIETLQKCEDVLQKLHSKVEKGTSAGLNFPSSKKAEKSSSLTTQPLKPEEHKSSKKIDEPKEPTSEMDETPASPDAPASPDEQSKPTMAPIIIPTERKHDYMAKEINSEPSSPEPIERVSTKEPIIIPTERKNDSLNDFVDNNKSLNNDSRNMSNCRLGPIAPAVSKLDSSKHIRLTSPECRSPRLKETFLSPAKNGIPPTPLLISPPRVLTEPPLSMDDLAELLNDGSDMTPVSGKSTTPNIDKKSSTSCSSDKICNPKEKQSPFEISKTQNEVPSKSFVLTQEDIDRESNRRWEEIDKHIVLYGRKGLPPDTKTPSNPQLNPLPGILTPSTTKKLEVRNNALSPAPKDRGSEPRYANNYERIPRQVSDRFNNASDQPQMPDMNVITSAFSRLSEGDKANLAKLQTNLPILHKQKECFPPMDDREIFTRRGGGQQMEKEMEFRRDEEYYMQRQMHHPQNREYYNAQWGSYEQNAQPGHPYQHPHNISQLHPNHPTNIPHHSNHPQNMPNHHQSHANHQDTWSSQNHPGSVGLLDHPMHRASPHHGPSPVRRPMMSPPGRPEINHGPYMEPKFSEDIRHSPQPSLIPPLMSAAPFKTRGFPDSRPFEPPMRPGSWEGARSGDPAGGGQETAAWNRGPCPDSQPIRGRNVERFPGDRLGRPGLLDPQHPGFNRRGDWDRAGTTENPQRFNRETINLSERDPRFRKDHSPQTAPPNITAVKRDPRLTKEPTPTPLKPQGNSASIRNPRNRKSTSKSQNKPIIESKSSRKKNKSKNSALNKKDATNAGDITSRRSSEEKINSEKLIKDKETMQSPLESLYGVIDTTAKTGKGYGLQKFKIPKIKRPDPPVPRAPTPPKPSVTAELATWDEGPPPKAKEPEKQLSTDVDDVVQREEKKMEVSSTTDEPMRQSSELKMSEQDLKVSEAEPTISNDVPKECNELDESETTVDTSTPVKSTRNTAAAKHSPSGVEPMAIKDEITREWIEKMIKTSLEQGEGKKLLEQAKLLQQLGEGLAHAKKFKKIRKILEARSESSSSDTEEIIEPKRALRKRRRVIMSDSSDDASLERKTSETPEGLEVPKIEAPEIEAPKTEVHQKPKTPQRKARKSRQSKTPKAKGKIDREEEKSEPKDEKDGIPNEFVNSSQEALDDPKEPPEAEAEPEPEPELESPTTKPRKKQRRRNSLEMLQEDIREMFISEGVVTATGHRMCRLLKEAEGNLKSVDEKVKGIYTENSPERHDSEISEEDNLPKPRNRSKTPKPRELPDDDSPPSRTRKLRKRAAKVAKQYVSSSDTEEELHDASHKVSPEPAHDLEEPKDSEKSQETPADEQEDTTPLRRSERVSLREPRVMIEKTDLGKIDSSKIMFDTSSDESFGIDVSELTAAVDISLHSDKQKRPEDASEEVRSVKKPEGKPSKTKKRVSTEPKIEASSNADEDTIGVQSDVSMLNSSASGVKKITNTSASSNTNEELITNILDGMDQHEIEEPAKSMDKENNIEAPPPIQQPRKTVKRRKTVATKRKRKRSNWQMGIVSKTKKNSKNKKLVPHLTEVTESSLDTQDFTELPENLDPSKTFESPTVPPPTPESVDLKVKTSEETSMPLTIKQEPHTSGTFIIPQIKKPAYEIQDLIDYAWTGQERYNCFLCNFTGKNIVHHYKVVHPKDEIMISRLTLLDAKRAINETKEESFIKLSEKVKQESECKYTCRFCIFTTEGHKSIAIETFYEHCTTHTGEYRFRCRTCTFQTPIKTSIRAHYYKICRKNSENVSVAYEEDPVPNDDLVNGYLCSVCNFIQLKEENIKKHINNHHTDDCDAEIIKIDMSIYPDIKNRGHHSDIEDELKDVDPSIQDSDAPVFDLNEQSKTKKKKAPPKRSNVGINSKNDKTAENDVSSASSPAEKDADGLLNKKLNAFVCPPDLENKEVEIQKQRQKTMQEVLNNLGTTLKNTSTRKGLSITDKLKDKMTTQGRETEGTVEIEAGEDADESQDHGLALIEPPASNDKQADGTVENSATLIPNSVSTVSPTIPIQTVPKLEQSDHEMSQDEEEIDKSEKKPRDPLISLEEPPKDCNSTEEASDEESENDLGRAYDDSSDTSEVMSDAELSTDVNTLLKETINTSTNAPMMTTIQRLAAQLQGSKSTENSPTKVDVAQPTLVHLPNLGDSVEENTTLAKLPESADSDTSRSNTPKNFIRLRRLSGDKLSCGTPIPEIPAPMEEEKAQELVVPTQVVPEVIENQEECSLFKIENVISLAPNASSDAESPFIDDIRKAVATSPVKNVGISVLKKSSPNILKKPMRKPIGKLDGVFSKFKIASAPAKTFVLQQIPKSASSKKMIKSAAGLKPAILPKPSPIPIAPSLIPIGSAPIPLRPIVVPPTSKPIISNLTSIVSGPKSIVSGLKPIAPCPKPITAGLIPNNLTLKPIAAAVQKIEPKPISPTPSKVQVTHQGKNYKLLKVVRPPGMKTKELGSVLPLPKEKTFEVFQTMLQPMKLRHLYKCMHKTCSYSTNSAEMFGYHFNSHVQEGLTDPEETEEKPPYGYQKCAYCHETANNWDDLRAHYKKKHIFCGYQCGYCFYRSFTQSYVDLHQSTVHQGKPSSVILGQRDHHPVEIIDRREHVHPFVCKHECNKLFYVPEAFIAHLKMKHGATLSIFKCHMCPASALKAEALISHYKMHGIYKYQCLYCLFGADAPMELHQHLSHMHSNRPPKILERSLPPSPVRDKDVLLQLIIKNLDENFKCSELMEIVETTIGGIVKRVRAPAPFKMITTDKKSSKSSEQAEVIDIVDVDPASSPPSSALVLSTGRTSLLKLPDGAVVEKQVNPSISDTHEEPELLVKYTNEQVKSEIDNAVDPLSIAHLNVTDEFVNINVLDNPEFLKSAEQRASERSPAMIKPIEEGKTDDDSDIEILECIETSSKPKSPLTPIRDSLKPFLKLKEEFKEAQSDKTTPTIVSSNENSNTSLELGSCSEVFPSDSDSKVDKDNEVIEKPPLTLDDIKHSGFSGKDLFRCGYDGCIFGATTAGGLRAHITVCSHASEHVQFKCVHCTKRFVKMSNLLDHFKIHGPKRFGCSLCTSRYPVAYQALAHMKTKHKISSHRLVPADPGNPAADALFVVKPLPVGEKKLKKSGKSKPSEFTSKEPTAYGPNDIERLPRQAIYNQEIRCAVCPYATKVRTNIIRHLQLHAKDEYVPESGPVNPVPCLDKKEKMFDKMVNLASSSHQNGRMGAKIKDSITESEAESLPKYVPEKQRYVCCVADCNCLTINEDLLRCHVKALHPDESFFRCPHCPPAGPDTQSIPIDKLGVHLKMHDTKLYKCSHCNHHHYHRHVVERHLTDKHPEKRPFVKVIREIDNPENFEKPPVEEPDEGIADPDGNHWKCNLCDYKCVYKTEMLAHATTSHDEKSQFKCTLCPFKTSGKITFEQHIVSKHMNDPDADYTMIYERIKGMKKPDIVEAPLPADEPFDTTPLWRRDMPRIRHIRGILLEEDNGKKSSESPKAAKRKSDIEPASKPAKIKGKSLSLDATLIIEKGKGLASKGPPKVYSSEELQEKFGTYGKPTGNMYTCTMCTTYSSKYRQDMRDHLYMELKYWRWQCKDCGHLAVSHTRMLKHENKVHRDAKPVTVELLERDDLEQWVLNLMNSQRNIMRIESGNLGATTIRSKTPVSTQPSPRVSHEDPVDNILPSSSLETTMESAKTVNLSSAISVLINNDESDDEDDDGNALVIDSPEVDDSKDIGPEPIEKNPSKSGKKLYVCKHCNLEFAGCRGFKIHVQINHLKRLAFICPYCDRSTNSETMMKAHIRAEHPDRPELIVKNPHANGPELTNAFWEKEYGIGMSSKSKNKKRKLDDGHNIQNEEVKLPLSDICPKCGFTAINSTGLAAHMRAHAKKHSLKCAYCTFTANSEADIWQHSEINHPQVDWKAEEINSAGPTAEPPLQYIKKRHFDDYHEDIEEEAPPVVVDPSEHLLKKVYKCAYCRTARSVSLAVIRAHWHQYHKDVNELSIHKTGVPFKFTESMCDVEMKKQVKCSYCPMKGSNAAVRSHMKKKHINLPCKVMEIVDESEEMWICKWCNETVKGVENKTSHHNMYHSHLSMRFQKQETMMKPKSYTCPVCSFVSATLDRMKAHVASHAEMFKCKRCSEIFNSPQKATQHSTNEHAGLAASIERVTRNVDALMAKVSQSEMMDIPEEINSMPPTDIFRNLGVARKSTTKQLLKKPSSGMKSVARKSTHPLPRYPPDLKFDTEGLDNEVESLTKPIGWSYYGRPHTPINLANLNTVMSLGVAKVKVKCTTLAKLMNIDAKLILVDFKKQESG